MYYFDSYGGGTNMEAIKNILGQKHLTLEPRRF